MLILGFLVYSVAGFHSEDYHCQRASRAKTVGLRGGQLNATRSIAAGTKILDRAVKSVMLGVDSLGI